MNQEVLNYLRAYISYAQNDWAKFLSSTMVAINNKTSSKTGFSPFILTQGYHLEPINDATHHLAEVQTKKQEPNPSSIAYTRTKNLRKLQWQQRSKLLSTTLIRDEDRLKSYFSYVN
ncbi:hypothetical protein K3495_g5652 [Podosphaera aphanis]|nr:hypothetical protein K3495_g5652 [Podosphaera aphanis]